MKINRFLKIIALVVMLCCLLSVSVFAQDQIIGQVLTTDIRAYVNGCEIPSYNINGKLAVIVSDLNHYGFTTSYNNDKRLSSVVINPNAGEVTELSTTSSTLPVGTPIMNVYATDITVELNGNKVESFNIGGKMAVYFKDLQIFGTYQYDNATRSSSLSLSGTSVSVKNPIAVPKTNEPITGTEKGISIHNWLSYGKENLYKDYTVKRNDEFSYCITETKANDLRIIKTYSGKPNTLYVVSADVKTKDVVNLENPVNPLGANISVGDYNNSRGILGTSDWQTIRIVGRSDAQGILSVSMNLGYYSNTCTGTAWFENIRVTPAAEYKTGDNTWKFLAVVLTETGIDVMDNDTNRRVKLSHEMSSKEISAIKKSLNAFAKDFTNDADGLFKVEVDIVESDVKCTNYTKDGNGYSISASAAYTYLEKNNIDIAGYDHVIMITCLPSLPASYYGLGGTFIDGKVGFSFVLHTDVNYCVEYLNGKYEGLWPSAVYIHEFLHCIESYSDALNLEIPVLHDGEKYGYTDKEEWREWYTDYIHKDVVKNGKKVGVDPQIWKLRPSLFN